LANGGCLHSDQQGIGAHSLRQQEGVLAPWHLGGRRPGTQRARGAKWGQGPVAAGLVRLPRGARGEALQVPEQEIQGLHAGSHALLPNSPNPARL